MDKYEPQMIVLDGGLDLQRAKLAVPKGRLGGCLNYEVVDRSGYKRIDGFEPFDGRAVPSPYQFNTVEFEGTTNGLPSQAVLVSGTTYRVPAGTIVEVPGPTGNIGIVISAVATLNVVTYNWEITYLKMTDFTLTAANTVLFEGDTNSAGIDVSFVADPVLDSVPLLVANQASSISRAVITALRSQPIGLHWFRDRLYAVADETVLHFNSGGTTEILVGDTIQDSADNDATVIDVTVTSGSWAAGTAAGALLVHLVDGAGFTSGNLDIVRPNTAEISNVATLTSGATAPWKAGLWEGMNEAQATEKGGGAVAGWNKVDTGLILGFEDGSFNTEYLPKLNRYTGETSEEFEEGDTDITGSNGVFDSAYPSISFAGDSAPDASTFVYTSAGSSPEDFVAAVADAEDNSFSGTATTPVAPTDALLLRAALSDLGATKTTGRVGLTNLNTITSVPEYARVVGIEVYLDNAKCNPEASVGNMYGNMDLEVSLFRKTGEAFVQLGNSKNTQLSNQNGAGLLDEDVILGASDDVWGKTELSLADVVSADFGVAVRATITSVPGADSTGLVRNMIVSVDRIRVKVYWESNFTKYFFWDGADDVKADLISYELVSGTFGLGNATGFLQVANVEPEGSAVRQSIKVGDEVQLVAGGGGTVVATITSVEYNSLAPLAALLENNSRYQFITANFYGDEEWDSFYGVSGAGRAFSFDGTYFTTIFVQEEDEKDKPRHVAYHYNHLALGFRSGIVHFSVIGDPENFSTESNALLGEDLSMEISVGDRVTGLLSLKGTTLAVYCENSIWGITGTTRDNFTPNILAPKTGCIEYTAVDMGMPIHCDNRGISTLAQSEKYGNFQGTRLSQDITSWLLPKLKRTDTMFTEERPVVAAAIPVRAYNQYLLIFSTGDICCMTLVGGEMQPQFTFRKYLVGSPSATDYTRFMVPFAWSAEADETGSDRIHVAHYSPLSDITDADSKFVYELNTGWGFAGLFIPADFTTSWIYSLPNANYNLKKVVIDGLSYGYSTIELTTARDLKDVFSTTRSIVSLPRTPESSLSADLVPYTTVASQAERGRAIALKFTNVGSQSDKINTPEPPHIIQVLLLNETSNLAELK